MKNNELQLETLIQGYQLSCQTEGKSAKTIEWYGAFLRRFAKFLQSCGMSTAVTGINRGHVRSFICHLQTEAKVPHTGVPLSPATVQGYVRALKAFFSWLEKEEYVASNPIARLPIPKAPTKIVSTFTSEDIERLIRACQQVENNSSRDLCILLLLLDTGVRVSELTSIEMQDVDIEEGYIKITRAKGSRERLVPIGSVARRLLWRYMSCGRPQPLVDRVTHLFLTGGGLPLTRNGVQQMVRRWGRRAGLRGVRCSPHTFRHTFAKNYLLNGGDIFSLQKILGHSSLASVRMYVNLFAADVKRQHQRFSPVDNLAVSISAACGRATALRVTGHQSSREDHMAMLPQRTERLLVGRLGHAGGDHLRGC